MSKEDTVAAKSGFLCTYMSNHPDTLVAYVRHQGKVNAKVMSATMTSISQNEMRLNYKVAGSKADKVSTITFDPPMVGYDEVKPRLLAMKLDAEESLGMVKRPQLTPFKFPVKALRILLPILALIYTTYGDERIEWLRSTIGGERTLYWIWAFVFVTHSLESLYTVHLCRKHSTGLRDGILYTAGTMVFGFGIWTDMRKRIQRLRIDSIKKVH